MALAFKSLFVGGKKHHSMMYVCVFQLFKCVRKRVGSRHGFDLAFLHWWCIVGPQDIRMRPWKRCR